MITNEIIGLKDKIFRISPRTVIKVEFDEVRQEYCLNEYREKNRVSCVSIGECPDVYINYISAYEEILLALMPERDILLKLERYEDLIKLEKSGKSQLHKKANKSVIERNITAFEKQSAKITDDLKSLRGGILLLESKCRTLNDADKKNIWVDVDMLGYKLKKIMESMP